MKTTIVLLSVLLNGCAGYGIGLKEADWAVPHSQASRECSYDPDSKNDYWGCMASKGWSLSIVKYN